MFKKNKCNRCGKSVSDNFKFCPNCGSKVGKQTNDGMLGNDDYIDENPLENPFQNSMLGGFTGGMLGKMLGSTLRMLEKEMQKEFDRAQKQPIKKTDFQLFINGKKVDPSNIKVIRKINTPQGKKEIIEQEPIKNNLSKEKLKKMSNLPREEPSTNVKRFSDQVIYEIDVPGVKSVSDVLINKLESSIEIKALAEDKVYSKIIPINLPIKSYNLSKNKLFIELESK